MTLKKQLTLMTLFVVVLSVLLNTLISSAYLDTFFKGYIQKQYDQRIEKLKVVGLNFILKEKDYEHLSVSELSRAIEEPIIGIDILNENQQTLVSAVNKVPMNMHGMMRNKRFDADLELLQDQFELRNGNTLVGFLRVTRNSSLQSTESVLLFKAALRMGALLSGFFALLLAVLLTTYLSRRLNKELRQVADYASQIQENPLGMKPLSNTTEINALILSLNDLSSKLQLQNHIQKRRADQLAHEARTPLTLLKTQLEAVLDGVVVMDTQRLESCLHEVDALTKTIGHLDQVLAVSEQLPMPNYETYDLAGEVQKIIKGMKLQFQQKNIDFSFDTPPEFWVKSDKIRLSQIVYNLLTNAYKFTPSGGTVHLSLKKENPQESPSLHLMVKDSGPGIDPSLEDYLFKPYYRDPSVRHIPGEGLGLYITKRNAESLGGHVHLENANEGGCIALVVLPLEN